MAIDQRDVSSTLRFMDDRALQQYAAMHKNDPYIFPLAFQESQNRQKIRMSQQTAQAMQPQPKVNEQALAQMAPPQAQPMAQPMPEGQGLGALPAGNMETMADGGIAGYPDDDFVTRNQSVVMMAEGGHVPRYQGNPVDGSLVRALGPYAGVAGDIPGYMPSATPFMPQAGEPEELPFLQRQMAAAKEQQRLRMLSMARERVATGRGTEADRAALAAEQRKADAFAPPTRRSEYEPMQDTAAPVAPTPRVDAVPKADTKRTGSGPKTSKEAASKETASTPSNQFDVDTMMSTALAKQRATPDPLDKDRETVGAEKEALARENVAGIQAIQKRFDNIFAGKKERLDTREGEIAKMKDQSLGLALLNAGAAMMSTRGNIGQALGAGIDTGSKQYVAGLDKINSAKEKLSDARDRLDELESQRGELSARELHKANQEVRQAGISVKEDMIRARMAFNNETYARAEKAVTNQLNANLKMYEQQQANVRTDKTVAGMIASRGDASGIKQDQVSISSLKAQADVINKQLENIVAIPSNAAKRKPLEDELARINTQLQQLSGLGTITPPPGAGSVGGNRPPLDSFQR